MATGSVVPAGSAFQDPPSFLCQETSRCGEIRRRLSGVVAVTRREARGDTFTLPFAAVLVQFAPAYRRTWQDAFSALLDDPEEAARVAALANGLRAAGQFDDALHVTAEWVDDDGEVVPAAVANGMHRLCAHHLTGIGPVRLTYRRQMDWMGWFDVSWRVPPESADDVDDLLLSRGSFRLDGHCWIGVDLVSHEPGVVTGMFVGARRACELALRVALDARFSELGPAADVVWRTYADLDVGDVPLSDTAGAILR